MPDDTFRLPGTSYEELVRIISAYGHAPDEASLTDVSKIAAVGNTRVSRNNKFLVAVGILEEKKNSRKGLTTLGRRLAKAIEYQVAEDIRSGWSEAVAGSDFLRNLVSAVRIRNGMEPASFQSHVAYSAGQKKSNDTMTGARTVTEILRVAGALKEHDGQLVALDIDTPTTLRRESEQRSESVTHTRGSRAVRTPAGLAERAFDWTAGERRMPAGDGRTLVLSIELQLQVACTPSDLPTLGPAIRSLIQELTSSPDADDELPEEGPTSLPDPE